MKNIYSPGQKDSLIGRINLLSPNHIARWGKMDVGQMVKHCVENEKMLLRQKVFRRLFVGRIFGSLALKAKVKDDRPLSKNSPTHPDLKIDNPDDMSANVSEWKTLISKYAETNARMYSGFIHPFFGKMSYEQVGIFAYKHIDHHLRQFGA